MSDDRFVASNPGRLIVNPLKYAHCFPYWPVMGTGLILVTVGLALTVSSDLFGWVVIFAIVNAFYWFAVFRKFWFADICPAVVVSEDPYLVAVWTDMTCSLDSSYPAVKVLRQPLGRMSGGAPRIGTRLAAVANDSGDSDHGHWKDFFPQVVNCVTTNERAIHRALASIHEFHWQELRDSLAALPQPFVPGVYFIEDDDGLDDERDVEQV